MTALRRSGPAVAHRVGGKLPEPEAFLEALANHRFRTIENAASEEISVGWVTPADPSGNSFEPEDLDAGGSIWLRMRIDRKTLPAKQLQIHIAAAEHARGRKLSAKERRELKDDLMDKLLTRVLPTTTFVDALLLGDRVLLLCSSKGANESFRKLFHETFGAELTPIDGLGMALALTDKKLHGLVEDLEPVRWPGGSTFGFDSTHGFLGEEFLLWLWFQTEHGDGEFSMTRQRTIGVAIDDMLMFPAPPDETQLVLRHGQPTRSESARAALRGGRRVGVARLIIAEGERQWVATLDGECMAFRSVRLPDDAEECESDSDRTADRAANWWGAVELLELLFAKFLQSRLAPNWADTEAARIGVWMGR